MLDNLLQAVSTPIVEQADPSAPTMPNPARRYVLFYDGDCGICQASRRAIERRQPREDVVYVDSTDDRRMGEFPMIDASLTRRGAVVLGPAGEIRFGYDAVVQMLRLLPRWRVIAFFMQWPIIRQIGLCTYAWVARNRRRISGWLGMNQCRIDGR